MTSTYLEAVKIEEDEDCGYVVWPVWANVDISSNSGFSVGTLKLANRLKRAFEAGAVYENASIAKNIYGETYCNFEMTILMRIANAELNRLGF